MLGSIGGLFLDWQSALQHSSKRPQNISMKKILSNIDYTQKVSIEKNCMGVFNEELLYSDTNFESVFRYELETNTNYKPVWYELHTRYKLQTSILMQIMVSSGDDVPGFSSRPDPRLL